MEKQAKIRYARGEVKTRFLIDKDQMDFQLVNIGFINHARVYGCFLHLHLAEDGKIWIQQDGTDLIVAEVLENFGIPKGDIVLGFHEPGVRKHTGYAVA